MANVTITDLSAGSALGGSELFEIVQTGASVKTTATAIKTFVGSSLNITGGTASSVTISSSTLNSCTINAATGSFGSLTISTGAIPFNTITNRAYAQFLSLRDQTATSANVAYAVSFDTDSSWNTGITMASSTNITFATAGLYNCSMNFQFNNTDTTDHTAYAWYAINGSTASNSGSKISVPRASYGGTTVFELNFQEQVTAGQYITLYWSTDSTLTSLDYTAASGSIPGIASVIFNAARIG